jgi:hypothetical protein
VRLRVDGRELGSLQADTDGERARRQICERSVEIAAAVAEPITGAIPAHELGKRHIRRHHLCLGGRDGNIPVAPHHARLGRPAAEDERGLFDLDQRQRDPCTRPMQVGHEGAQVGLALDRPVGREQAVPHVAEASSEKLPQMAGQRGPHGGARLDAQRLALGRQTHPLGPAANVRRRAPARGRHPAGRNNPARSRSPCRVATRRGPRAGHSPP